MAEWRVAGKKCDFKGIGEKLGVDQVVVRVMRNRDMLDEEDMRAFLWGNDSMLHSYETLKDIDKAIDILLDKIDEGSKIRIIGDYDVDGIMATYILWKGLSLCGADVDTVIPHRIRDGYGISEALIEEAAQDGIDTIITCDNGIAAIDAFDRALELGITCIVTDHHEIPFEDTGNGRRYIVPDVPAVIDPKQEECDYPYKNICGAVVAYKVIEALLDAIGEDTAVLDELRELAGFATVCDVMELRDENRVLVKNTLLSLKKSRNIGMRALVRACELEGKNITTHSIGFVLGPCINATGRLESASLSLELLQSETIEDAMAMANELKRLNEKRKQLTDQGIDRALELIEEQNMAADKIIVVYIPELHESLAGIVAGRIKDRYGKPTFVCSDGEEIVKGSARSVAAYNIYESMSAIKDVFIKFGGHAMAAGFSIEKDRIQEFRDRINKECKLTEDELKEKIIIDVPMPLDYVTMELAEQLSLLEPFGNGNPKPIFADKNVEFISIKLVGQNENVAHITAKTQSGKKLQLVLFRNVDELFKTLDEKYGDETSEALKKNRASGVFMDIIYYPSINEYQGRKSLQYIINDFR